MKAIRPRNELINSLFISRAMDSTAPSVDFRTTFPTKPSQTTISTSPLSRSLPSMFPTKFKVLFSNKSYVNRTSSLPLPPSSPMFKSAISGLFIFRQELPNAWAMTPNWNNWAGRQSTLAPASIKITGPFSVGTILAIAGLSTPLIRPRAKTPAARVAPEFPALITASAWPSFTRRNATRMELSFFFRRALSGDSPIATASSQWWMEIRSLAA